jgi:beta-lactamase regulating signal transducer with metallopeptidase domain/predicted aspartyl protease
MARLNSWLSPDVLHALGWALIHSLWQCLGLAALAAIAMAFSRRPSIRYVIATAALVAMLAAPAATFLVLMKPAAPVHAPLSANPRVPLVALPATPADVTTGVTRTTPGALPQTARHIAQPQASAPFLPPRLLSSDFLPPSLLPWLVGAWLCGVALFSLRFAGGFLLLEHRCRGLSAVSAPRILALCHALQTQLGLNRAIRYLECGWLQTPAVIGWIRPIILLPVAALTGLSETQLRAIIAHELAHIRRHDFLVNLLQMLVETLLFYHPAIWWLNKRIRAERELCCDEIAVALTGDRLEYAKVLTLMADWDAAPGLAMAANRGPLSQRIFHILGRKPFGAGQRLLGLTGSVLFLAGALGAANALFGIAYPIPIAHAKADLKPISSPTRIAIAHATTPTLPPAEPVQDAQRQDEAVIEPTPRPDITAPAEDFVAPVVDLSALPAQTPLPKPVLVASNDPPPTRSRSCAVPAVADSVGLKSLPGSDLMTVPVKINGTTKQFLLDLDTDPTEVSAPVVAELQLPHIDRNIAPNIGPSVSLPLASFFDVKSAANAQDYQARVRIASFAMGDATVSDMQFLVADDRDMGKSEPYDGRLTRSNFPQYDIDLDFGGRALRFLAPTSCTDPDEVAYWSHAAVAVVPMTLSSGKMQVQVTIGGHVIDAVIDTGSARTIMRRDVAERIFGLQADTSQMRPAGDLRDGADMPVYAHTFAQISFTGGVTANNVPALIQANSMVHRISRTPVLGSRATFATAAADRIPDLSLGMDVLHQLHLYAAFDQNKLYVTAAQPASANAAQAAAEPTAIDQLRLRQAIEARTACTAQDQGPTSPQYGPCVNSFLQSHYGWQVGRRSDGSLHVRVPTGGLPQYY